MLTDANKQRFFLLSSGGLAVLNPDEVTECVLTCLRPAVCSCLVDMNKLKTLKI